MSWIERVADRGGPLTAVAQRFAKQHQVSLEDSTESTLRGLVRALEHDGSSDERTLVEGAGALLGVILIHHFDGRYRNRGAQHRCEVSPLITFDPFAAVERAIDADSVRNELATQVALAESEAKRAGPVSTVLRELEAQLGRSGLPHQISDAFDHTAWLGPDIEVDLGRVVQATREGVPVERAVRRIVDSLAGASQSDAIAWKQARERLLPRIVNADFLGTLPRDGADLLSLPLAPGLSVTLTLSFDRRSRFVRAAEVDGWGVTPETARRHAIEHLAARCTNARIGRVDGPHGAMIVARTGDGLDSARILLPGMFELLQTELGPCFRVGLPHRDTLVACSSDDDALIASTQEHVQREARRAPHTISETLWWMPRSGELSLTR